MLRYILPLLACVALWGCDSKQDVPAPVNQGPPVVDQPDPDPVTDPDPDPPVTEPEPDPDPPVQVSCTEWTDRAYATLDTFCSRCHQAPAGQGGMNFILDAQELAQFGQVRPFDADASPVYARMWNGTMPPVGYPQPSPTNVLEVREWIACGALDFPVNTPVVPSPGYVAWYDSILLMAQDIGSRRIADQLNTRYLVSSVISNADPSLAYEQRESMILAMNSLSLNRAIAQPVRLGRNDTVFRIDLRDYGWAFEDWERLIQDYPYGIRHEDIPVNSGRYDAQVVEADEDLRAFSGTEIPYVNSDWFLGNATRAQLYYDLLKIPATLPELEAFLGINIAQDIADEVVYRAGFNTSGVSEQNRVIERHDLFVNGGYFWASYDFVNNAGERNIFADPINFQEDGGEFIWTLPNGLQAYAIADAAGTILAKAPQAVVRHNDRPDAAVEAGISCMGCHHNDGIIAKDDVIREYVADNFAFGDVRDDTFALYPSVAEMRSIQQRDQEIFRAARNRAGDLRGNNQPVLLMVLDFEDELSVDRVAANYGLDTREFLAILNADPDAFPAEFGSLRSSNGSIKRDAFDRVFAQGVCALGLGEPICQGAAGFDGILGNADDIICNACSEF